MCIHTRCFWLSFWVFIICIIRCCWARWNKSIWVNTFINQWGISRRRITGTRWPRISSKIWRLIRRNKSFQIWIVLLLLLKIFSKLLMFPYFTCPSNAIWTWGYIDSRGRNWWYRAWNLWRTVRFAFFIFRFGICFCWSNLFFVGSKIRSKEI